MSMLLNSVKYPLIRSGIATIVLGAVLLAFPIMASAEAPDYSAYDGSASCKACHEENYNDWYRSGHPYKLMKSEEAMNRPIPLPHGVDWDGVSYVIGGYKWKSRVMDDLGYIITNDDSTEGGKTQYNYLTDTWSDYHADEANGTKPYDCGSCHTTAWIADTDATTDDDLTDNQDGLEGIWGTFVHGGVHCEECHGPGGPGSADGMQIDQEGPDGQAFCGRCHIRGDADTIPAGGGFVRHHEQYNELLAGPHGDFACTTCHDPHKRGEFSIIKECKDCHGAISDAFLATPMADYGVECKDCHMPFASKSAAQVAPHMGDLQTHIFSIDTDPEANMFTDDGLFVDLDGDGKAAVTMDFACQRCHLTASLDELALFAEDFHGTDKSLEDIGLDPGLTGTWWDSDNSGEGYLLEVGFFGGVKILFGSFYTYDTLGGQVWLTLETASIEGNKANVNIYMPEGAMWGDDFNPADVDRVLWGTGSFEFPTCTSANIVLTPNQAMMDLGFTAQAYPLTRTLESGTSCPTFVNNEMAAAAGR